jgi:hypothetical protein
MPPQNWTQVISASVVPVAIISACALLCLALYNRLASMVSRLRGFQRERLQEYQTFAEHVREGRQDPSCRHHHQLMLQMLELQTRRVYRRARMMRWAILSLLAAISGLTLSSLATGLAMLFPAFNGAARAAAVSLFMGSMTAMFAGVVLAIVEMWDALEPVQLESQFVGQLARELGAELLKDEDAIPVNGHDEAMERG